MYFNCFYVDVVEFACVLWVLMRMLIWLCVVGCCFAFAVGWLFVVSGCFNCVNDCPLGFGLGYVDVCSFVGFAFASDLGFGGCQVVLGLVLFLCFAGLLLLCFGGCYS